MTEKEKALHHLTTVRRMGDMQKPPPCPRCGNQKDFNAESDGCLGFLPGVVGACCGHGDRDSAYVQFQDGTVLEGFVVGTRMPKSFDLWVVNEKEV